MKKDLLRVCRMLQSRVPRRVPPPLRRPPPPLGRPIGGCRQVTVSSFGGPAGLELRNVEFPPVFEYDVLVRVQAVSINTIDLATSSGLPSRRCLPSPPFVLGYYFGGEVLKVGSDVEGIRVGEDVFGIQYVLRWGTYSEY